MKYTAGLAESDAACATEFQVAPWQSHADPSGWDALAAQAAEPNSFAERWFVEASLDAFDQAGSVALASLTMGGRLAGIMPLVRSSRYESHRLPHMRNWLHTNAFCGVPLVAAGCEHAFWRGLLHSADENARGALFLHLEGIPADGPLYAALRDVCLLEKRPAAVVDRIERALLCSDQSPGDYYDTSLSTKKRKELRRQFNRLSDEGVVSVLRHEACEDLEAWIENFLSLEAAGWKGADGSALACNPATAAFFRSALTGAARAGKLDRLAIALDGKPIAMLANFVALPGIYSFKTAYDERLARFSPGVLLQRENLSLLARDGVAWSDSCAAPDHPMIERIWREKREIVRVSVAIGGRARRAAAALIFRAETGRSNHGL
ncbi:hypothetical protein A6F68_01436 [Tsuneonella dongtanensis]|uniref:BioF2-like acetyltransferase domain-containing protein n=1 Tax=Tsuneonella dongtanensis TaxID=692370 RepID=A0A1B2ACR9_9SPHN|nr:GNAT family N-acetyltransferase [Tsuneonella dongtanensis]ANY19952.1 hypothetical protein A6F68_01436 [Tsuneonella dongtanensis]